MALFSEEMLLQGHFPLKFWVRSSWKESHMSENQCQVFRLQLSCENVRRTLAFFTNAIMANRYKVLGRGPPSCSGSKHLRYRCFELLSGPRDFVLIRRKKMLLIQWNVWFVNPKSASFFFFLMLILFFCLHWLTTPVFLPGECHGQRRLMGYSPWGRKESEPADRLTLSLSCCMWNLRSLTRDGTWWRCRVLSTGSLAKPLEAHLKNRIISSCLPKPLMQIRLLCYFFFPLSSISGCNIFLWTTCHSTDMPWRSLSWRER